jgi:hypothetical protein
MHPFRSPVASSTRLAAPVDLDLGHLRANSVFVTRQHASRRAAAFAAVASFVVSACGGAGNEVRGPQRALPQYGAREAELFDDGIEPSAIGYDVEGGPAPAEDALLRARAQEGDAVVRARITTITSKALDRSYGWQIGFHTLERIAGDGPLAEDFAMQVAPTGAAAGMVRAFEPTLVGKTFIAFAREFSRADDPSEPELHVHLAEDGKAGVAAVHDAMILQKVR